MNSDTQRCEFHERMLNDIHGSLKDLGSSQAALAVGQESLRGSIDGVRNQIEAGFRAANGRTTKLEDKMSHHEAEKGANDYFTVASTADRRDIWNKVSELQKEIDAIKSTLDKADGFARGASRATVVAWVVVGAVITWVISFLAMHQP